MTLVMMILVHIEEKHSDDNSDGDESSLMMPMGIFMTMIPMTIAIGDYPWC